MFCSKCGKELNQTESFCPNCGTKVGANEPVNNNYRTIADNDGSSIGFAILSFFIPVVGLVLFLVWRDTMPLKAKSCLRGFIANLVLDFIIICCAAASISSSTSYYYYNSIISLF